MERVRYVSGEALALHMERRGVTVHRLAALVYGEERAQSQRKRIQTMLGRSLTLLGTRGMDAAAEEWALVDALGASNPEALATPPTWALYEDVPQAKLLAPGGIVLSWSTRDLAGWAAKTIGDSGLYEPPTVRHVTEGELEVAASTANNFFSGAHWLNQGWATDRADEVLPTALDVERFLRGDDEPLEELLEVHQSLIWDAVVPAFWRMHRKRYRERHDRMGQLIQAALNARLAG